MHELPKVRRKPIQTLEEALSGTPISYRYFLEGGNGRFPALLDTRAVYASDREALAGKPFIYGPWVLRVVERGDVMCIVSRRWRPDLRAWYWVLRRVARLGGKFAATWRLWVRE